MLLFKKKFIQRILSGEKTQTIRLWKYRRMKPGQRSYIPGVGYISINTVEPVRLDALQDADAVPDGFATAEELRKEIRALYPKELAGGYQAYRITFTRLPEKEQLRIATERKIAKQKQEAAISGKKNDAQHERRKFDSTMEKLKRLALGK